MGAEPVSALSAGDRKLSKPEDHLIRADAIGELGARKLGRLAGMSRLTIEEHRLDGLADITLPAGREQFIYVQDGSGNIGSTVANSTGGNQPLEETVLLSPGDFVTLMPEESASLSAGAEGLLILVGRAPREIRGD